jgi:hypothetical protein
MMLTDTGSRAPRPGYRLVPAIILRHIIPGVQAIADSNGTLPRINAAHIWHLH